MIDDAIRAQAQRLADDCARRDPRVRIKCERGCLLVTFYDHPTLGAVVVKKSMTRPRDHARGLATSEKGALVAAPLEVLIDAAGAGMVGSLLACPAHLEASVAPEALRWLARQRGDFWLRFSDLQGRNALPYNGIEVYDLTT